MLHANAGCHGFQDQGRICFSHWIGIFCATLFSFLKSMLSLMDWGPLVPKYVWWILMNCCIFSKKIWYILYSCTILLSLACWKLYECRGLVQVKPQVDLILRVIEPELVLRPNCLFSFQAMRKQPLSAYTALFSMIAQGGTHHNPGVNFLWIPPKTPWENLKPLILCPPFLGYLVFLSSESNLTDGMAPRLRSFCLLYSMSKIMVNALHGSMPMGNEVFQGPGWQ